MRSQYYIALEQMDADERAELDSRLDQWVCNPIGQVVLTNLRLSEFLLPIPRMLRLVRVIWSHRQLDDAQLADAYRLECHNHVLQGGEIKGQSPVLLGRAVDREVFAERLYEWHGPDRLGPISNLDVAKDFVRRLATGDDPNETERQLSTSEYASWVTWNEADNAGDPFAFASPRRSACILAFLGMAPIHHSPHRPLLLLTYLRSSVAKLFYPTVADAGTYQYFQPPQPGADYGRTRPWPAELAGSILATSNPPVGQPEALHEPITFAHLDGVEKVER